MKDPEDYGFSEPEARSPWWLKVLAGLGLAVTLALITSMIWFGLADVAGQVERIAR